MVRRETFLFAIREDSELHCPIRAAVERATFGKSRKPRGLGGEARSIGCVLDP